MKTVRVICGRTFGRLLHAPSTFVAIGAFLSLSAVLFVGSLMRGDGGSTPVAALWAVSAVPVLPVLAALLTMRLVAEDRLTSRLDTLLTAPVLERDLVVGRFMAAWLLSLLVILLYSAVPLVLLPCFAPALRGRLACAAFLPACGALALQSLLWCACGLLASVCCRQPAVAAVTALLVMLALPHAAFRAACAWLPALRTKISEMPFDAHIVDLSTGVVPVATLVFYLSLAFFAVFAAVKILACARFRGRGARRYRAATAVVVGLAFVFSCLLVAIAVRYGHDLPAIPLGRRATEMSARTRQILAETHGEVRVTSFLAKRAPEYKAVDRLLRGLETTARAVAGTRLVVENVDPRWDLGAASAFVRAGTPEGTIVFRRGRRRVEVPVSSLFQPATNGAVAVSSEGVFAGESACASALQRLARTSRRESIYWTTGHGELSHESHDAVYGLSDIVRDLRVDGYRLASLDLAKSLSVPEDCSVLVVAGAREPFSHVEMRRLSGWLKAGGRLLVLAGGSPNSGIGPLLVDWGVKALPFTVVSPRTLTGSDVIVSDFPEHKITAPLAGGKIIFAGAVPLERVALAPGGDGKAAEADRTGITVLAQTDAAAWGESDVSVRPWTFDPSAEVRGPLALAFALERGGGAAKDLAVRPTRIVVIGDASFVTNGALAQRANANRDFFLNALAWLAGLDALTAVRMPGDVVQTGLDRAGWVRFGLYAAGVGPCLVVLCAWLGLWRRRRSS
ncbi:MAG: DUF4350 domain-containing protein [Kiritimatiellia bacterium]